MSDTDNIVRDIFGESDESGDEFEGFDADSGQAQQQVNVKTESDDEVEKEVAEQNEEYQSQENNEEDEDNQRPELASSDDENDGNIETNEQNDEENPEPKETLPDLSDSSESGDDDDLPSNNKPELVYDFDIMMQKKKEQQSRKRGKRSDDIINDSDDVIAELIRAMKHAADEDCEFNRRGATALQKLKLLPLVEKQLKKVHLREALLDAGILAIITDWLTRLPDGSLPHLQIRENLLKSLIAFNIDDVESIKASGIGKAVMYLFKCPKETKENKRMANQLISKWSRPIFNLDRDFHAMGRDEREKRDFEHMARFKRQHSDGGEASSSKVAKVDERTLKPGDKGWVPRARVPMPSMRDYVVRPKSSVDVDMSRISTKKSVGRFEKHIRNFRELKKVNKMARAVPISIEGRKMAL